MTSAQQELSSALRKLSDSRRGVISQVEYANNRLTYSLESRAKTIETLLHEWKSDVLRIWRQLRAQGIRVGKLRVQRLMQKHGVDASGKRSFRLTTTDSTHNLPIAPNILNCIFTLAAPNQAWVRWSSHLERSQSSTCGSRRTLTACRRAAVPDSRAVLRSAAKSRKVIPPRHLMPLAASFAHNYPPPAHNSSSQSCERGILVPCRGPGEGSLLAWVPVP
jgi:hypothetical protein